jgi:hypothetical protein
VLLFVLGLAVLGLLIIVSALRSSRTGRTCPRTECGNRNPPAARYCGRCGTNLDGGATRDSTRKRA